MRTPTVTSVRGLIGIMRGPASDEDKVYAGTKTGTEDIKGFGYKKLVGSAFLAWLTGYGDITQFMNGLEGQIIKVGQARNMALARIKEETEKLLGLRGLDNDTANLLEFLSLTDSTVSSVNSGVSLFTNSAIVFPKAFATWVATALPICRYFAEVLPANTQSSGNPCILAYSLTLSGRVLIG